MTRDSSPVSAVNWIDTFLPRADFRERHNIDIAASAGLILDCAMNYRLKYDPLVRLAIGVRELPSRLSGRSRRPPFDRDDFTFLGRKGDTALAFGLIGEFWNADYGLIPCHSAEDFRTSAYQDACKLVLSYTLRPLTRGTNRLTTETSVFCPTPTARRHFAPYWYLIRPVSGLIRRRMLAAVRKQAENRANSPTITG